MKNLLLAAIALLPLAAEVAVQAAPANVTWRDGREFDVEGQGWSDTESPYDRFPARAKGRVPDAVWNLSRHSAGLAIRFRTDATALYVRWSLVFEALDMPHMPATGVSGVDLYVRGPKGDWHFVGNGRPTVQKDNEATFRLPAGGAECLLYLPLYNGTAKLELAVPAGATLEKAAPRPAEKRRPIAYYGTSIAQGGCASRPGMAHVAIIGRRLDRPMINLGFSGNGQLDPASIELVAELDPVIFVIDATHNINHFPPEEIEKRVTSIINAIREKRPDTPIVLVGSSEQNPANAPARSEQAQDRAIRAARERGVKGLHVIPGRKLLGDDGEGTVDGVHPTDLGFLRHADAITPVLRRILSKL
jgi:hypothetical protein